MGEHSEVIEESAVENKTYRVIIVGGFAIDVQDAKSEDYAEGLAVASVKKEVPSFMIKQVTVSETPAPEP